MFTLSAHQNGLALCLAFLTPKTLEGESFTRCLLTRVWQRSPMRGKPHFPNGSSFKIKVSGRERHRVGVLQLWRRSHDNKPTRERVWWVGPCGRPSDVYLKCIDHKGPRPSPLRPRPYYILMSQQAQRRRVRSPGIVSDPEINGGMAGLDFF